MHAGRYPSQTRLWLGSILISVVINAAVIGGAVIWSSQARTAVKSAIQEAITRKDDTLVVLAPVMDAFKEEPAPADRHAPVRSQVDTAPGPTEEAPKNAPFFGERNTRASSNAPASEGAPAIPSLRGKEADGIHKLSSVESRYQDGDGSRLGKGDQESAPATPEASTPPVDVPESAPPSASTMPPSFPSQAASPGTAAVDRETRLQEEEPPLRADPVEEPPTPIEPPQSEEKPSPQKDDGITRESEATAMEGSLSLMITGSLEVEDTPRGRYTANIVRTVEKQSKIAQVKYRDFTTAGTIRVRVTVEQTGKVRSVVFGEEYGIGSVQKGMILSSVRDSKFPAMPADLKRQLGNQPIEIHISFIFGSI